MKLGVKESALSSRATLTPGSFKASSTTPARIESRDRDNPRTSSLPGMYALESSALTMLARPEAAAVALRLPGAGVLRVVPAAMAGRMPPQIAPGPSIAAPPSRLGCVSVRQSRYEVRQE